MDEAKSVCYAITYQLQTPRLVLIFQRLTRFTFVFAQQKLFESFETVYFEIKYPCFFRNENYNGSFSNIYSLNVIPLAILFWLNSRLENMFVYPKRNLLYNSEKQL